MSVQTYADGCLRVDMGRVTVVELNAPSRKNAINRAMWAALPEIGRAHV